MPKEIPMAPNALFQRAKLIQFLNLPADREFPDERIRAYFGRNYTCNEIKASIHSVIAPATFVKIRLTLKPNESRKTQKISNFGRINES
jgi:hypothetical protein